MVVQLNGILLMGMTVIHSVELADQRYSLPRVLILNWDCFPLRLLQDSYKFPHIYLDFPFIFLMIQITKTKIFLKFQMPRCTSILLEAYTTYWLNVKLKRYSISNRH
jgi:hypothetical protein